MLEYAKVLDTPLPPSIGRLTKEQRVAAEAIPVPKATLPLSKLERISFPKQTQNT